jgi:putative hydrolase of the HAD superfamily
VAYVDDRLLFVQVAKTLGMHGIHHTDYKSTCAKLASLGLT